MIWDAAALIMTPLLCFGGTNPPAGTTRIMQVNLINHILFSWSLDGFKHVFIWLCLKRPVNDDVIKWKLFPRCCPFVRGIHRSQVNSPHKGQWRGALMFSLICAWTNGWVNNRDAGDLRRYRAHYDVIVMDEGIICPTCMNSTVHSRL